MSTIKVNEVQPVVAGGGVKIDGQQMPTDGALSHRNLLYNGGMTVSQRGTSGSTTSGGGYPSLDRWSCNDGGIADFTVSQSTDAPAGFANSAKWVCTATGSPTNDAFHEQKLEGQDIQQLAHGTSSAKDLTISFWVKSNKTGEYSLWVENNDANRYFTTPGYTINTANTWEFKSITVPGDTGGSGFNNDNGISIKIRWHLVLRTSFQGTPSGSWSTSASLRGQGSHVNLADSTNNEWYITGVQAEIGSKATPFEHRSYGDELQRCMRYYETGVCFGMYKTSDDTFGWTQYSVQKRANPSVEINPPGSNTSTNQAYYHSTSSSDRGNRAINEINPSGQMPSQTNFKNGFIATMGGFTPASTNDAMWTGNYIAESEL